MEVAGERGLHTSLLVLRLKNNAYFMLELIKKSIGNHKELQGCNMLLIGMVKS